MINLAVCKLAIKLLPRIGTRSKRQAKVVMSVYAVLIIILVSGVIKIDAISYVSYASSLNSSDGNFKLQWAYHNSLRRLFFKMTCRATFWCAVGFTTTADGKNMVNYDIATVLFHPDGGVYISDLWSTSLEAWTRNPPNDNSTDYDLIEANETDGSIVTEFCRDAFTGDKADVQFMEDTEVTVVWASLTSSHPDRLSMLKHNKKGILSGKHNLIKMSTMESGGGTPPIPTMESGGGTPPIPTKPSAGVLIGPYFASCILLACLSVHLMSF